jgi:hypothetical protein
MYVKKINHGSVHFIGLSEVFVGLLSLFMCPFLPGLNRWEDIEKLNSFPKLEEVRLQGIPLLQTYTNTERRSLMIAQ